MKNAVAIVKVPHFIKKQLEVGEWVAFEGEDYTTYAEVRVLNINPQNGRINVLGIWGNESVINVGDLGWQSADQCRKATEDEQYWEERRRVFAAKGRRNNEFHPFDFASNGEAVLTVLHQNPENGLVSVLVNNSDERFEADPKELEILFFAEDMAG